MSKKGNSITAIANELGRQRTTVFREVKQNSEKSGYRAFSASRRAQDSAGSRRRRRTRLEKNEPLREYVLRRLNQQWSPCAISKRLKVVSFGHGNENIA
ncbi:MAG: helix-turn-helix domain-containing protein [Leptolinea sp.]|nr:helix-turn-helix domain-containing protein [Leptolinea sp.]